VVRASNRTFAIRWVETAYENGLQIAAEGFSGTMEIVFEPPRTAEALLANPSGIYVHSFASSRSCGDSARGETGNRSACAMISIEGDGCGAILGRCLLTPRPTVAPNNVKRRVSANSQSKAYAP
jgi:hypothetical protein